MREETEILDLFSGLRRETLHLWIERGWLAPARAGGGYRFREIDVARLRLIFEFSTELAMDDEALDVVLPLLDQLHGLRRELQRLAGAVNAQPEEVRARIMAHLDEG
ncbi:chaperone modulator CbpM [Nisaea sediminum]|uniref:chaperone modulator CbpM n=1 Tax=Nisaea sediminum TaxID=2775867 RepID=UPI001867AD81|nr:chaperone modulator CbpM [Nisaea sediminum]